MRKKKQVDLSRRRTLARLGVLAAYTAPSLTTLLLSNTARADDDEGHPGHPPCDRPHPPPMCAGSLGSDAETPQRTRLASSAVSRARSSRG